MAKRKFPPPPPPPGVIPQGSVFDCRGPYCSGRRSVVLCGMKHRGTLYNSFLIDMGVTADCTIEDLKDSNLWNQYNNKLKGEEESDDYFPDPEPDVTLRYAGWKNYDNWDNIPGEEDPSYPWDENFPDKIPFHPNDGGSDGGCFGEEESGELGCLPPPLPDDQHNSDTDDSSTYPLPPWMGGEQGPPTQRTKQLVDWFLSQGEEGREVLRREKEGAFPRDPTQPIDPSPLGPSKPSGGGRIPTSPVGPGVMTPVDDELPDSMKRKFGPLFTGVFPEIMDDEKVPRVSATGPRPIDPAGPGEGRVGNHRPIPKPSPVDPRIATVASTRSKRKGASPFSLAQSQRLNLAQKDPDEP